MVSVDREEFSWEAGEIWHLPQEWPHVHRCDW